MKKIILVCLALSVVCLFPSEIFSIKKPSQFLVFTSALEEKMLELFVSEKTNFRCVAEEMSLKGDHYVNITLKDFVSKKSFPVAITLKIDLFDNRQLIILAEEFASSFYRWLKVFENEKFKKDQKGRKREITETPKLNI